MKKIIFTISTVLLSIILYGQKFEKAPSNKSIVYFVRNSMNGASRNIKVFDSASIIGKFNGRKSYIVYECDPGDHLFGFAVSQERADFVLANLEMGKTYIVLIKPGFGKIIPYYIDYKDKKEFKAAWKIIGKKPPKNLSKHELEDEQYKYNYFIYEKLKKYNTDIQNGEDFTQIIIGLELPDEYLTK
jgi:hypothetical protein